MQNSRCFLSFKKEDTRTKQAVFREKKEASELYRK